MFTIKSDNKGDKNNNKMNIAISINKIPIRLTDERWQHISVGHPEMANFYYEIFDVIESPDFIYEGKYEESIATKKINNLGDKFIAVVYKEININDGFVITAYISNKKQEFLKRKILWQQQK